MKYHRLILLTVLFCFALFQIACSEESDTPVKPDPAPAIYRIVFSLDMLNDEHNEIYTIQPDGNDLTRLTISPATSSNGSPIWSPDGKYIYYKDFMDEENEIIRMNADGTHQVNLTQYSGLDRLCDLSPDGTRLAFISTRENDTFNIFVMDLDSMTVVNITRGDQFYDRMVKFTPDGQKILYSVNNGANFDLCLVGVEGTGRTILSNLNYDDTDGIVSPDGQRIVYVSQFWQEAYSEIWVCSIDGNNRTKITTSTNDKLEPSWSPNGQKIVFTELLGRDTASINVINADGTNLVCLTDSTALDYSPRWSPDGSKIVYISRQGAVGTSELFIIYSNGLGKLQLTNTGGAGTVYEPSWSPGL